jgi:hypothetical protein
MDRTSGHDWDVESRAIIIAWLGLFAAGAWFLGLHAAQLPARAIRNDAASVASAMSHTERRAPLSATSRTNAFTPIEAGGRLFWLSPTTRPGDSQLIDVVGTGDVMMGSRDVALDPALTPGVDVRGLVGKGLASIFARSDISFANLEGTLTDGGEASTKECERCYAFRSPTWYAKVLADLGVRTVSLANNHSGDYGEEGRDDTIAALRAHAIGYCGLDRDGARIADVPLRNGGHAAVIAFAPNDGTLDINDRGRASAMIRALKKYHRIVIVSFHGGAEGEANSHVADDEEYFDGEDRGNVLRFAHDAIDAGADLVLGQGPHIPRAVEIYRGRLIAYSLGNFWTYGAIDTSAVRGLGPVIEAWLGPDGSLAGFAIHSTTQQDSNEPRLDPSGEAARQVLALTKSDFPATASILKARNSE